MEDYRSNLLCAIRAACLAGVKTLEYYNKPSILVKEKEDQSPVTDADYASNSIILGLLKEQSSFPIISEETRDEPFSVRKSWNQCWIIDPLDGTKEFINCRDEFTVNIALIEKNNPVLGVVYAPVLKTLYFGMKGVGSYKIEIEEDIDSFSKLELDDIIERSQHLDGISSNQNYVIIASKSHPSNETNEFIQKCKLRYDKIDILNVGSSLKICLVAEGKANVYPRLAPTMEWDTAAAHAVAKFANCSMVAYDTYQELKYNKENLLNPWFVVTN